MKILIVIYSYLTAAVMDFGSFIYFSFARWLNTVLVNIFTKVNSKFLYYI